MQERACQQSTAKSPPAADQLPPERFEAVLRSISDGVFAVDLDGHITCFNRAAEEITGYSRQQVIGRSCREVLQSDICEEACALRYTMETGTPVVDLAIRIKTAAGKEVPVSISTALFCDRAGEVIGGVETFRDLRQVEVLRRHVEERYTYQDIVSKSTRMRDVLELLPTIADSGSTVLITGESGSGKELVARALHDLSGHAKGPFVAINSAGVPDTLLEAELFGYEPGAFTGATRSKAGRFARAAGGTLFLDEIGELPQTLQVKLLRVLQEHSYEPLGGERALPTDARIVAATNRDLSEMVARGTFRKDLYYRLHVFELHLPPLRERMEDVPLLVDHFIRRLTVQRDKRVSGVSPEAMRALMEYDYPGNVRELENAIEHGFVLAPGSLIHLDHLPAWLRPPTHAAPAEDSTRGITLEELERRHILATLERNDYNRQATARQLGIHKTSFFRKVRKLGITLPVRDGRSGRSV